jgi:pseudouridine-5'-phosphate glycosidase
MQELLNIAPEVVNALSSNRPVVALESTVIAYGLPRPENLQTALRLEAVVREGEACDYCSARRPVKRRT